jgi:MoxR-like ATPase
VIDYVARLVRATRPRGCGSAGLRQAHGGLGSGTASGQNLVMAGKAFAAMDGRFSVAIHIKKAAMPVLRHRMAVNFQAQPDGKKDDIVLMLFKSIEDPDVGKCERRRR